MGAHLQCYGTRVLSTPCTGYSSRMCRTMQSFGVSQRVPCRGVGTRRRWLFQRPPPPRGAIETSAYARQCTLMVDRHLWTSYCAVIPLGCRYPMPGLILSLCFTYKGSGEGLPSRNHWSGHRCTVPLATYYRYMLWAESADAVHSELLRYVRILCSMTQMTDFIGSSKAWYRYGAWYHTQLVQRAASNSLRRSPGYNDTKSFREVGEYLTRRASVLGCATHGCTIIDLKVTTARTNKYRVTRRACPTLTLARG